MSQTMKTSLPLLICFGVGTFLIFEGMLDIPAGSITSLASALPGWGVIVVAFAFGVGLINLLKMHGGYIQQRKEGQWPYSIAFIASALIVLIVGFGYGDASTQFQWIYEYLYGPLGRATWGMWFFYISVATYRTFKARTGEAAILLITGILVMLGNAPIGGVIWEGFNPLRNWILSVPNMAGMRGITIGVALGSIAMALRILMGIERRWLGAEPGGAGVE